MLLSLPSLFHKKRLRHLLWQEEAETATKSFSRQSDSSNASIKAVSNTCYAMQPLVVAGIVALVVAAIIAIIVWTIVLLEYRKILKQRKIDRLIDRIVERTEDSGNESEGDQEELSALMEMGHHAPWPIDDM